MEKFEKEILNEVQVKEARANMILKDKDIFYMHRPGEIFGDFSGLVD